MSPNILSSQGKATSTTTKETVTRRDDPQIVEPNEVSGEDALERVTRRDDPQIVGPNEVCGKNA